MEMDDWSRAPQGRWEKGVRGGGGGSFEPPYPPLGGGVGKGAPVTEPLEKGSLSTSNGSETWPQSGRAEKF